MHLFMVIEGRWRSKDTKEASSASRQGPVKRGTRELRNLTSSLNYEVRKRGGDDSLVSGRGLLLST
jgi:hypothetical protein